ncbi:DUF167 domain-containing protein [bacterium]|nr:DUF167 domain-containing protein [bacterium]
MLVKVKFLPNSKKEGVVKKSNSSFEVRVKEKPIQGKATRRGSEILAEYFKVPRSKVRLVRGFRSKNKIFDILLEKSQNKYN